MRGEKVRLNADKRGPFGVLVPSTDGFDRLSPEATAIWPLPKPVKGTILPLKTLGILRCWFIYALH
jgi:hypothetical protein